MSLLSVVSDNNSPIDVSVGRYDSVAIDSIS